MTTESDLRRAGYPPAQKKRHGMSDESAQERIIRETFEHNAQFVTIPRAKYEALMAAAKALEDIVDRGTITLIARTHTNEDIIQALEDGAAKLAALRAAGIHIEEK